MRGARSLAVYMTVSAIVSIIAVAALLGGSFAIAVTRSVDAWENEESLTYQERVANQISNIIAFTGSIDGETVERYLEPYLDLERYVAVFDPAGHLLFHAIDGLPVVPSRRRITRYPSPADRSAQLSELGVAKTITPEITVSDQNGVTRAIVIAGSSGYATSRANRAFSQTAASILLVGSLVTLPIALFVSILFARTPARATAKLARTIAKLPDGDIGSFRSPIRELSAIATAGNRLAERLRSEEDARQRWMQDIAHDLRTPLAVVWAQLEAIRDGVYRADADRLSSIMANLAMVQRLIDDLALLSTLEAPERQIDRRLTNLRTFLEELAARFSDTIKAQPWDDVYVAIDGKLMERAVVNLIDNALAYRDPADGIVELAIASTPESALISISNPGSTSKNNLLFERLYRGDPARSDGRHGLGLSIARAIAELHGGELDLTKSGPPAVEFTLRLPVSGRSRLYHDEA